MFKFESLKHLYPHILSIPHICIASYSLRSRDNDYIAWADEVQNPKNDVMFLITSIIPTSNTYVGIKKRYRKCPKNILTNGELWHPLLQAHGNKYVSYPTGYDGVELNSADQEIIIRCISKFIKKIESGMEYYNEC